jgi:alkylation response protein AidB-like acyl-CoA dehydrogenase
MDMQDTAPPSADVLIAAAGRVARVLEASAAQIDAARELPPAALEAMHEAGMFRLLLPRSMGGVQPGRRDHRRG